MASDPEGSDLARRHVQHVAPTYVTLARRVVDLAELDTGHSVLDLCTGTGLAAFMAAERVGRDGTVIGLDRSPELLAVTRERATGVGYDYIHWHEGEPAPLTYADESFDAVLCVQALMLLPRPDQVLEEARRVLVEGGRFVVTIWGAKAANEWIGILEDALRRSRTGAPPPKPYGLWQPGNLEALLQTTGFEQIEVARVPDRMRFRDAQGFWQWALAVGGWAPALGILPESDRERVREALLEVLAPFSRHGEVAVSREIVYARAVAPTAL